MPIRVIGGSAGGRLLKGPPRTGLRPTSDRVREAIFDMLAARDVELTRVLDLYSGTGAMGIEALSRGAEHCDFVEANQRTADILRENLRSTGLNAGGTVLAMPVMKALGRLAGPYNLVVADPPYEYDRAEKELAAVAERGLVAEDGLVVVEHSKRHAWPEELGGRTQALTRRYGDTAVTMYQ